MEKEHVRDGRDGEGKRYVETTCEANEAQKGKKSFFTALMLVCAIKTQICVNTSDTFFNVDVLNFPECMNNLSFFTYFLRFYFLRAGHVPAFFK